MDESGAGGRRRVIWSAVLASLLAGFLGAAAVLFVRLIDIEPSRSSRPPLGPPPSFPVVEGSAAAGPRAAATPVRTERDLEQVCESWYFPGAPLYRGTAPHPILISVRSRLDDSSRTARTLNLAAYAGSASRQRAWAPQPVQAQLVACLDLIAAGPRVRECRVDHPVERVVPLREGRYRLTVYEVATRKRVSETKLTGKDPSCPWVSVTGPSRELYTGVYDDQLYRALRKRVER
jgi:hypothetical protein